MQFLEFISQHPAASALVAFLMPLLLSVRKALIRRVDRAWEEAPPGLDAQAKELHAVNRVMRETKLPASMIAPMVRKKNGNGG